MTLLFDENISYRIIKKLKKDFPDCLHVTGIKPSLKSDFEIFQFAKKKGYIVVTCDEDFYELQLINGFPPKIVWLRLGNSSTDYILKKLLDKKQEIALLLNSEELGVLEIY